MALLERARQRTLGQPRWSRMTVVSVCDARKDAMSRSWNQLACASKERPWAARSGKLRRD